MTQELITAAELLGVVIDGRNTTLRDLISLADGEGQLSTQDTGADESDYIRIANKLLVAVLNNIQECADPFGGDACDFGEWVGTHIKRETP